MQEERAVAEVLLGVEVPGGDGDPVGLMTCTRNGPWAAEDFKFHDRAVTVRDDLPEVGYGNVVVAEVVRARSFQLTQDGGYGRAVRLGRPAPLEVL